MVFEGLKRRAKKRRAKELGVSVEELEKIRKELKQLEGKERVKFAKWKIQQKYKQKRKQAKSGKSPSITSMLESLAGSPPESDPLGIFETQRKSKKKSTRRKRK